MKSPHELMNKSYSGPAKVIPLGQIRNEDGFRFIGIDRNGGEHYCIVRERADGLYYMSSNTALFSDLIGWLPDTHTPDPNAHGIGKAPTGQINPDSAGQGVEGGV